MVRARPKFPGVEVALEATLSDVNPELLQGLKEAISAQLSVVKSMSKLLAVYDHGESHIQLQAQETLRNFFQKCTDRIQDAALEVELPSLASDRTSRQDKLARSPMPGERERPRTAAERKFAWPRRSKTSPNMAHGRGSDHESTGSEDRHSEESQPGAEKPSKRSRSSARRHAAAKARMGRRSTACLSLPQGALKAPTKSIKTSKGLSSASKENATIPEGAARARRRSIAVPGHSQRKKRQDKVKSRALSFNPECVAEYRKLTDKDKASALFQMLSSSQNKPKKRKFRPKFSQASRSRLTVPRQYQ